MIILKVLLMLNLHQIIIYLNSNMIILKDCGGNDYLITTEIFKFQYDNT